MGFEFTIIDNVDDFKAATDKQVDLILEAWGLAGERFAKQAITAAVYDTPQSPTYQRTGRLRASLTYATHKEQSAVGAEAQSGDGVSQDQVRSDKEVVVGTNVEYGPYVEYGTTKMPPRPYLRPAIENHVEDFKDLAFELLKDT